VSLKMKFVNFCVILAAFFAVCYSREIYVNTSSELEKIMTGPLAGDNIIVSPGRYSLYTQPYITWNIAKVVGTESKPITLSCAVQGLCEIDDAIVVSASSYFTISGFKIGRLRVYDAITIQDCDHISLSHLDIHDGEDNNLWIVRTSNCDVKSCNFQSTNKAINIVKSLDCSFDQCNFGESINDVVLYIDNSTQIEFTRNEIYGSKSSYGGGSWVVEINAGGNLISDNQFGFGFSVNQKPLKGYLASGSCLYGPTTLKNNLMDLNSGMGFAGCKDYKNKVCASNSVVGGASFTDGDIDGSC